MYTSTFWPGMLKTDGQTVGRYSPNTPCSASLTSPRVARALSASFIGGRLPVPPAVSATASRAASTTTWSRLARRPHALDLLGGLCFRDALQLDRLFLGVDEPVHADDPLPRLDALLDAERGLVDLVLVEARLDRAHGAAHRIDLPDVVGRETFELLGERFDVVRARDRVDRLGHARLVADHLLRAQRDRGAVLGRERERLVERVRVQRLGAAEHGGERLEAVRTMFTSGCCAVSVAPPVCVWNRSIQLLGSFASNRSRMTRAHMRRAARNFAISSKKCMWQAKKNERRGAKSSTPSPASSAACT